MDEDKADKMGTAIAEMEPHKKLRDNPTEWNGLSLSLPLLFSQREADVREICSFSSSSRMPFDVVGQATHEKGCEVNYP